MRRCSGWRTTCCMSHAGYLRHRAARFRELAGRAANPEDECYLQWRAAEADHEAACDDEDGDYR